MITSTANPRVKALAALRDRGERDRTGRFVVEGRRVVERALAAGWPVEEIVVGPESAGVDAVALAERSGLPVTELGIDAFARVAYRQSPDGILAVAASRPFPLDALDVPADGLVLVVEAIEKPGNLGAVLRTAEAAGVDAVVAADPTVDVFNPNVVRASQGSLFTVPLGVAPATETRRWLDTRGLAIVVARPTGVTAPWHVDLVAGTALVVGSEHAGVSESWNGAPSVTVPMQGTVDSLNAATTAALLMYEAVRQRAGGDR